jgi:hypothetical protein
VSAYLHGIFYTVYFPQDEKVVYQCKIGKNVWDMYIYSGSHLHGISRAKYTM